MLCYAMLCYAMLCYAVLCCAVLCCAVLCCAVLRCAMLPFAMLCCAVLCCHLGESEMMKREGSAPPRFFCVIHRAAAAGRPAGVANGRHGRWGWMGLGSLTSPTACKTHSHTTTHIRCGVGGRRGGGGGGKGGGAQHHPLPAEGCAHDKPIK